MPINLCFQIDSDVEKKKIIMPVELWCFQIEKNPFGLHGFYTNISASEGLTLPPPLVAISAADLFELRRPLDVVTVLSLQSTRSAQCWLNHVPAYTMPNKDLTITPFHLATTPSLLGIIPFSPLPMPSGLACLNWMRGYLGPPEGGRYPCDVWIHSTQSRPGFVCKDKQL